MKCFINKAIVDSRLCPSPVLPVVSQFKYLLQYQILLQHTELLWVYTPCLTFVSPVPSQCVQLQIRPIKPEHTYIRLMAFCPGLPGWAGTRKVKPMWILLKQETVSDSDISWAICKSVPHSRQITMPAPHHSVFYRPDALPAIQPTASRHWRHKTRST